MKGLPANDASIDRSARASHRALRWLPGLELARRYDIAWLRSDLVAGLVMTTMLVPVGIAYAEASGVPGINGLYATIIPLLAYALLGPSRILVLGPDSSIGPMICYGAPNRLAWENGPTPPTRTRGSWATVQQSPTTAR